jgi:hypothetical protein
LKPFISLFSRYFSFFIVFQFIIGCSLDFFHQKHSFFKPSKIINNQNWREAKILIIGSSRALTSFDSRLIAEQTGKKTVNLAIHDTGPSIHKLLLELAIEQNYFPETIILQYDQREAEPMHGLHEMDYQFLPLIFSSKAVNSYFKDKMGALFVVAQYVFPIWKYAYWNTELLFPIPLILQNPNLTLRSDSIGDYEYPESFGQLLPCEESDVKPTILYNNLPLFEFLTTQQYKHGFSCIMVTAPTYNFYYQFNFETTYINGSTWFNCEPKFFYDEIHLNAAGKRAFTNKFIETLSANFSSFD